MKIDLSQELATFRRIQANNSRSSYSQAENVNRTPSVAFGDRDIQQFMLRPENPPADLEALYAAIRHQMTLDGCA